ncbi:chitobiase/beta-hexosaminidase C-terminal domain-containing protein, partial [Leptospira ellisii]
MKEKEIEHWLLAKNTILGNGFLWCTIFFFSCLGAEKQPGFKFFFLPTSLQNFTGSPVSPPIVAPNQANLSVAGGKSLYNGVYYASRVSNGDYALNVALSFANVTDGSVLKVCMNNTGCVDQDLLYNGSIGSGLSNLNLNLMIPDEYPVVVGGNTLNFAIIKDSQTVVQRSVSTIYDVNGPTLTFSTPGGSYSSAQNLSITCVDSVSGCQDVIYTADGQTPSLSLINDFDPLQIALGSVFPSSLNIPDGTTTIIVSGSDRAGNITGPLTVTYTVTIPPPPGGGGPSSPPPTITLDSVENSITNGTNESVLHWNSDTIGTYSVVPSGTDCANISPGDVIVTGTLATPGNTDTTVPYASLSVGS